ncbi:MAG: hypothetical protein ACFFC3_16360 [Candidatus Odinarchaeota archaeon]
MPSTNLDWTLLRKLDTAAKELNIFTYNVPILISSLCDKSLEMLNDLKELTDSILEFLDQNKLESTQIAQKALSIYQKYFRKRSVLK